MSAVRIEQISAYTKDARIESKANAWKKTELALKEAQEANEKARQELVDSCENENYEGNGVKVSYVERKGSVDYAAVPELKGKDLELYRKKGTFYWTIKLSLKD